MENKNIETHPLEPFLPKNAKVLMMGTFPPPLNRWSTYFFYPNFTNDMWRIMGIIFFNNKDHFINYTEKKFRDEEIKAFFNEIGFALCDTVYKAHRLKGNASDKFLEVIEPKNIKKLLDQMPSCKLIITTGEKAMEVACEQFGILKVPKVGHSVQVIYNERNIEIYRMPSSSRAYPLKVEKKAEYYKTALTKVFNV